EPLALAPRQFASTSHLRRLPIIDAARSKRPPQALLPRPFSQGVGGWVPRRRLVHAALAARLGDPRERLSEPALSTHRVEPASFATASSRVARAGSSCNAGTVRAKPERHAATGAP